MSDKKKLVYVANIRMPTEKAHGVQIMNMCRSFVRAGFEVELLVSDRKTPITESVESYYGIPDDTFTITRIKTLDTVRFGRIGFWLQAFSFALNVRGYLRRISYDVLYSRDEYSLAYAPKTPAMVYEVHTNRMTSVIQKALRKTSHVVVIAQGIADFLISKGVTEKKILVAHDGVNLDTFASVPEQVDELRRKLSIGKDKKVVGYIGKTKTMGIGKGIEDIVSAFGIAYKINPELMLLFVGVEDNELENVNMLCMNIGLSEDAYRIVGHVAPVEVPQYMQLATVLVLYYPNTDHYRYYMSPLKLFEYMASKKAIISSQLPSIEEVLEDGVSGILVEPEQPQLLGEVISRVSTDVDLQNKLIEGAYTRIQDFTWDARAQTIRKFIELK